MGSPVGALPCESSWELRPCAFLHFTDELPAFGCEVIPLLREERVGAAVTQDSAARAKILA
jgi:hypothetical protein